MKQSKLHLKFLLLSLIKSVMQAQLQNEDVFEIFSPNPTSIGPIEKMYFFRKYQNKNNTHSHSTLP